MVKKSLKKQHSTELKKLEKLGEKDEQQLKDAKVTSEANIIDTKNDLKLLKSQKTKNLPTTDDLIVLSISVIGRILLSKYIL